MYALIIYNPVRDYIVELNNKAQILLTTYLLNTNTSNPEFRLQEYRYTDSPLQYVYGKTIFEEGKTPVIYINLRSKDGILKDMDVCTVILIHELTHLLQMKSGHDDEFTKIESRLLDIAYDLGIVRKNVVLDIIED